MQAAAKKTRIYLVDDQMLACESLVSAINRQPDLIVCGEAQSAALAMRDMTAEPPDLLLLEISLRESSGLQLIKAARAQMPELPIIVLTMVDEKLYAERCIRAGASGYISKYESSKRVLDAIREVLGGRLFVSGQIAQLVSRKFTTAQQQEGGLSLSALSDRELEVFQLLGKGLATRQVADRMNISIKTVEAFCRRIKQKLQIATANQLLREAIRWDDQNIDRLAV